MRTIIALGLPALMAACHQKSAAAPLPVIDWSTSPLDLNLRGMNGGTYLFRCPIGKPTPEAVVGSDIYTDASAICPAAAHAGELDPTRGGVVLIRILPGQNDYRGTIRNYIFSQSYAPAWGGSFAVLSPSKFQEKSAR